MSQLSERLGPDFRNFVMQKNGDLYAGIMFMQDGALVPPRLLQTYTLQKDCILTIIPIVSGG
jgi:hypothetical protein